MLHKISSTHFFTVIIIVVGVYYGFVVARYFRDFRRFWQHARMARKNGNRNRNRIEV